MSKAAEILVTSFFGLYYRGFRLKNLSIKMNIGLRNLKSSLERSPRYVLVTTKPNQVPSRKWACCSKIILVLFIKLL